MSLIRHGEVSGLLSADERAEAVEKARALDSQREKAVQTDGSVASLYELFLSQVLIYLFIYHLFIIIMCICRYVNNFMLSLRYRLQSRRSIN